MRRRATSPSSGGPPLRGSWRQRDVVDVEGSCPRRVRERRAAHDVDCRGIARGCYPGMTPDILVQRLAPLLAGRGARRAATHEIARTVVAGARVAAERAHARGAQSPLGPARSRRAVKPADAVCVGPARRRLARGRRGAQHVPRTGVRRTGGWTRPISIAELGRGQRRGGVAAAIGAHRPRARGRVRSNQHEL